jgi:hypothetical protein
MSDTLTREPLNTSLSFLAGHHVVLGPPADPRDQPLAYLYAEWDGQVSEPMGGHYDQDTQTWTFPPGTPTAGIATNTSTSCYQGSDTCRDDTCA